MLQILTSEIGEKWIQPELKLVVLNPDPLIPPKPDPQKRKRRSPGEGSGYIQLHYCEKQTKSGVKSYEQYYYHYELEQGSKRVKRSAYIPKDKLDVVLEWERKKVAVTAILIYLGKSV